MKIRLNPATIAGYISVLLAWTIIFAFDYRRIGLTQLTDEPMSLVIHAAILVGLAGAALLNSDLFRTFAESRSSLAMLVVASIAMVIGFMRGNPLARILLDLKILAWVYGGYALFCAIALTRHPRVLVGLIAAGVYVMLINASAHAEILDDAGRIGYGVYWDYSELSLVMLGLIYYYLTPVTKWRMGLFISTVILHGYYVLMLGRNRSDLLAFAAFGLCAILGLRQRYKSDKNYRRARRFIVSILLVSLAVGTVISSKSKENYVVDVGTPIVDRLKELSLSDETVHSRLAELSHFFEQSSLRDLVIGRGFGATIRNVNNDMDMNYMHIAIFSFLMKLGAIPFLVVILLIYVKLPFDFLRAVVKDRSMGKARSLAIIRSYPFPLGWLALTLMSAGIDWYFTLGLGMLWAAYDSTIMQHRWTECDASTDHEQNRLVSSGYSEVTTQVPDAGLKNISMRGY